jgi:hypothetical protein
MLKLFVGLMLFMTAVQAHAANTDFWNQKASIKKASRWTLEEWLVTKERMQWSNMWLSFNSPSPYEFFLLGAYAPSPGKFRFGLGAYAVGVGLEYEQENVFDPSWNARFHFRVFGENVQNTNLTFHGGMRGRSNGGSYRQGFAGVSFTLYLKKFFGVWTQYRSHFGSTPTLLGKVSGERFEIGPFLDFGPLRVFGFYLKEAETANGGVTTYSQNGSFWNLGAQLFF